MLISVHIFCLPVILIYRYNYTHISTHIPIYIGSYANIHKVVLYKHIYTNIHAWIQHLMYMHGPFLDIRPPARCFIGLSYPPSIFLEPEFADRLSIFFHGWARPIASLSSTRWAKILNQSIIQTLKRRRGRPANRNKTIKKYY